MSWIKDDVTTTEGDRYIVFQLYTACCKEVLLFKCLPNEQFFDMQKLEVCDRGWNELIRQKLKVYHEDQRFKT